MFWKVFFGILLYLMESNIYNEILNPIIIFEATNSQL